MIADSVIAEAIVTNLTTRRYDNVLKRERSSILYPPEVRTARPEPRAKWPRPHSFLSDVESVYMMDFLDILLGS